MPVKRTYRSRGGNGEGLRPDPSTDGDKKNPWNVQEAEADDKKEDKEKHNGDGDKKTTPLLGFRKKKADEAFGSQDKIFAIQDQDLDTQADGTSLESKSVEPEIHNASTPRRPASGTAASPPDLEQVHGQGDAAQVE
ncbi:MAG: hypothetical protein LQ349_004911 [Xanthoria aureola]|nr:MAG: hypothetical protein LQ349_004911 [Xanthoria aureola]